MASRCSPIRRADEVGLGGHRELRRPTDLGELVDQEPVAGAGLLVGREAHRHDVDLGPGVGTSSLSRSPSSVRGRCSPGVSTRTSWASGRCTMPRTTVRVVCGLEEVIATFWPTSALVSVDLPALGRPTKQANPLRNPSLGHGRLLAGAVVVGPDLLVGLAGRLAGALDRSGIDLARLPLPAPAPVAHHVVCRGRSRARASGASGCPASAPTPRPSRSSPARRASRCRGRSRRAGSPPRAAGRAS